MCLALEALPAAEWLLHQDDPWWVVLFVLCHYATSSMLTWPGLGLQIPYEYHAR